MLNQVLRHRADKKSGSGYAANGFQVETSRNDRGGADCVSISYDRLWSGACPSASERAYSRGAVHELVAFFDVQSGVVITKKAPALEEVFNAYVAFAQTSGKQHGAVWFVKQNGVWQNPADLDVERSVEYCRKFRLVPSEGPHIVVLTVHPDKWRPDDGASSSQDSSIMVLALGGSDTRDIATLIRSLNDRIVLEKLSEKALKSEQYWLSWVRVLERGCKLLDKVKFTVTAKFVKVEKEGVCT